MSGVDAQIRAWAKGVIEGVEDANAVFDHGREIRNQEQFDADFGTGANDGDGLPVAKGWTIQVVGYEPEEQVARGGGLDTYIVRYRCFWSVTGRGESEKSFVPHVIAVVQALGAEARPGTIPGVYGVFQPTAPDIGHALFGKRLAHTATVTQQIQVERQMR